MHANLPVIANRWEKKYGLGGVAELNAELNSLPEYYLPFPAAQGGRIPLSSGSNRFKDSVGIGPLSINPRAAITESKITEPYQGTGPQIDKKTGTVNIGADIMLEGKGGWYAKGEYDQGRASEDIYYQGEKVMEDVPFDHDVWRYGIGFEKDGTRAEVVYNPKTERYEFNFVKSFEKGGLIPAHQAGIYGLAEGGRIGFPGGGGTEGDYQDDWSTGAETTDTSSDDDHGAGDPDQFDMTPPTKDTTPDDSDGDARSKYKLAQSTQKKPDRTGGEQEWGDWVGGSVNQYGKITPYEGYNISDRMELQAIEKAKQQQRSSMGRTIGGGLLTLASFGLLGPTAAKLASYYKTGKGIHSAYTTGMVPLNIGPFRTEVDINKVLDPVKARLNKEIDIDPSGLDYGKDLVDKTVIEDTDNGQTNGRTDIQKEGQKIALKRKQEQEWASYLAQLAQEKVKQAYLKNYRQSYMSAKGGRVPGYNTGGLSNLFKLKTA